MAGVTNEGFVAKTIEEIKAEIDDDLLSTVDASLNLAPDQPIGQINAAHAKKLAELWELGQVAYNGIDRDNAEGRLLDNCGALTGSPRDPARKSVVVMSLNLNAGFSQPAGVMMVNVLGSSERWVNRDPVATVGADASYEATFESVNYGPIAANAGTLTQITNPITGWNSATNPEDAELGALEEEDDDYRQRQDDELTSAGSSTVDAIRVDLLDVKGVLQAYVFENTSLITDVNGVPGKAIECVVYDGVVPASSNTEIAQAIWDSKPSGCETHGSTTAFAIDKLGIQRAVKFSRATVTNIYLEYDIKIDAGKFPLNGIDLCKEKAVTEGNESNLDDDVIALHLRSCILARNEGIPGVVNVTAMRLGTSASPVGTSDITISGRAIARFDTSRVIVNIIP